MKVRFERPARSTRGRRRVLFAVLAAAVGGLVAAAVAASSVASPTITSAPANPTNSQAATFAFTGASSGATYECTLDSTSAFTACTSPKAYGGLSAGTHTFRVRVKDKSKYSDPTVFTWVIDLAAPPAPAITAHPSSQTSATTASLSFTDSEAGVGFQCKLDAGSYAACTSPASYSGLALGSHTFSVQAKDAAGNVSGATSFTWSVVPPTPTITSKPANPTNQTSASFSFSDTLAGVTYVCALDTSTFTSCSSPQSYPGPLAEGSHTFQVKAVSGGNQSDAASYTWAVDTTPPPTPSIVVKPASLSNTKNATFAFSDSEAGVGYLCNLDGSGYLACSNPITYPGLTDGSHSFSVKARDAAGNVSAAADSWSWTIDTIPPPAPLLTDRPDDPNGDGIANFNWTEAESGVTFLCSIENGKFTACPNDDGYRAHYIVDVSNDGTHQFAVRAYDAAGNFSETDYSWKVLHAVNVVVDGNAIGLLYPGAAAREIALVLHNPNNFPITITYIDVSVRTSPPGCPAAGSPANIVIQQSNIGNGPSPQTITVPANSDLPLPPQNRPTIRLVDTGLNQDACKNGTFTLSYLAKGSK
jgi:large repetitive protein